VRLLLPAALLVASIGLSACGGDPEVTRDEAGAVASPATVDAFAIELGDCMDQPVSDSGELEEVDEIKVVPCTEPHDGEVFEVLELTDGDFPGDEALTATVDEKCSAAFDTFIGMPFEESALGFFTLQPTEASWEEDDREVVCIVGDPEARTTGSLKDAAR
jgi:hypothetical protein